MPHRSVRLTCSCLQLVLVGVFQHEDSAPTSVQLMNTVAADAGYGGDMNIPSILITKSDGGKLIESVKKGEVVGAHLGDPDRSRRANRSLDGQWLIGKCAIRGRV